MLEHPLWDKLVKQSTTNPKFVTVQMLLSRRNYFINQVKAPLMDALIKFPGSRWWRKPFILFDIVKIIRLYPEVTRTNTTDKITLACLDIVERFNSYHKNWMRQLLFKQVYKLFLPEIAHDLYYNSIFNWWVEEIIKKILIGEWKERPEGWPPRGDKTFLKNPDKYPGESWWDEPTPYGGKHSIVYKMLKHREEILKILES
jgi:hypothetical protein